ncbi:hypothetical protein [Micromonospora zhanjiangensis]|uniref:PIN domain-containing protein n=1 Tax=Micromonospora zhanjiangensis TaxID=1522057 RepID=A0ABV8KTB4_9ACTN
MTMPSNPTRVLVLDTMCLSQFVKADRFDELQDLLVDSECWTTRAVIEELRAGSAAYPALSVAFGVDWLNVEQLDTLAEIKCFMKWATRLGAGDRDLGEASVIAAAELRAGVALTDDRDATRVARKYGADVHGTIWLLARACRDGKLAEFGAGNLIDALRATGARLPCTGAEFGGYARRHGLL